MRHHTISFRHAANGIYIAARTQLNIRIHLLATALVLLLGSYLKISVAEALILLLTIAVVMIAELANTALEFLSDAITTNYNENIKNTKDIAAGAVLLAAIFACLIGGIIFLPKIFTLLAVS